jgi:radical SAM protein with 4Fe4S-binding SPASM domain
MEKSEKYILNPAYYIGKDKNRVILCNRTPFFEDIHYKDCFSFIHPLNAQFLTFFNGNDDLDEVLHKTSSHFGLPVEKMQLVVQQFIENTQSLSIKHGNAWVFFPENLVINKKQALDYYTYNIEDFPYESEPDLITQRLEKPLQINMELTMQCYTNCIYCYANRKMHIDKYLSLERILAIIKNAKNIGVLNFEINGGEVLLHPNCKAIVSALIENGYQPSISTKTPISHEQIVELKTVGLKSIQISLDSAKKSTLNKMLGVDDSYIEKIEDTIKFLEMENIRLTIHCIITSYNSNMEEMNNLVAFVAKYNCVKTIRFSPAGYSLYKPDFENIRTSEKFMNSLRESFNENENYPNIRFAFSTETCRSDFYTENKTHNFDSRALCTGNVRAMVILPDGKVTVCEELYDRREFIIGDLTNQTIEEVWNSDRAKELFYLNQNALSNNSSCKKCDKFDTCRQGRGVCWKMILMAYGYEYWDFPDPRCPDAPDCVNEIWINPS